MCFVSAKDIKSIIIIYYQINSNVVAEDVFKRSFISQNK